MRRSTTPRTRQSSRHKSSPRNSPTTPAPSIPTPPAPRASISLLLRGVDHEVLDILKARAQRHGRSLQAELQLSLRRAAHRNFDEALAISQSWQARHAVASAVKSRRSGPSAKSVIAQDRRR